MYFMFKFTLFYLPLSTIIFISPKIADNRGKIVYIAQFHGFLSDILFRLLFELSPVS